MTLKPNLILTAALLCASTTITFAKPLKVFILAGQSNMQGWTSAETFDYMADDPKTAPILKEMRVPDGKPRACQKVWISSIGCAGNEQTGKVTLPEFKGNVVAVPTAPFWDDRLDEVHKRWDATSPKVDEKMNEELKKTPNMTPAAKAEFRKKVMTEFFTPEDQKRLKGLSHWDCHYHGCARILVPIGKAFAEAMVNLQKTQHK